MEILVYGAGAIGSVFGGFLSRKHGVTLLGRPWHLHEVRRLGLQVTGIWGSHTFTKLELATEAKPLRSRKPRFDLILCTVTASDTAAAAKEIKRIAKDHALVLSLQNGYGNIDALSAEVPIGQILAGRVIFGAELTPGVATVTVSADDVLVGEAGKSKKLDRAEQIAQAFTDCGIKTKAVPDIHRHLWAKLIYNCALNGLATLLDIPYGKLLLTPETKELMKAIVEEIYAVAKKRKADLEPTTAAGYLQRLFKKLIPVTSAHYPSMLHRIRHGHRTEIAHLNGAIVELGKRHHVATPINALVAELVKAKERLNFRE
jgi:2-dehydropantoate 2-reductase